MMICHIISFVSAIGLVCGFDKRRIGNKEFGKEKVYSSPVIDVDMLLSKGYEPETIKAMLGQDFIEKCLTGYFDLIENIEYYRSNGRIKEYLNGSLPFMLFREIQHARLFWLSYRARDKYAMSFRDITEAFFDYIGKDKEKLKKYASYSRYEWRALEKANKNSKDIFDLLASEAECLWNDMLPSFAYGEKHDIPTRVFFYEKETTQEGTSHLLTPVQELINGNTKLYKELPKRCFLERLGITKEDAIGTPYEYLFDNEIEQLLSNNHMDFDWRWIAEQGG